MQQDSATYLSYLYAALAAKWGVVVETDNIAVLKSRILVARREHQDPDLWRIQLKPNPLKQDSELWLIKGEQRDVA